MVLQGTTLGRKTGKRSGSRPPDMWLLLSQVTGWRPWLLPSTQPCLQNTLLSELSSYNL